MIDTPDPSDAIGSGVPVTGSRRPRWTKVAIGLGAAAGVAVGATAIAGAATSSNPAPSASSAGAPGGPGLDATPTTPSDPSTAPSGMGHHGGFGRGGFGGGPGAGGFALGGPGGRVVHGQYTVQGPSGYETLETQTGKVTAVSETDASTSTWSLTVTSTDNFVTTYVVNSGTNVDSGEIGISAVGSGDSVDVTAVLSGTTSTAKVIQDITKDQANRQQWAGPPPTMPSSPSAAPSSISSE